MNINLNIVSTKYYYLLTLLDIVFKIQYIYTYIYIYVRNVIFDSILSEIEQKNIHII